MKKAHDNAIAGLCVLGGKRFAMDKPFKNILINSTLAFIAAFIITTIIHEIGHYLSYLLFGANPTLFHNYVQTPTQSMSLYEIVISALAGPFISLMQGTIFGLIVTKRKSNNVRHLFYLWLSLLGFVNSFGYLLITPFSTKGDTGKVAEVLNIDSGVRFVIAFIGLIALLWIIFKVAKNFTNFIPVQKDLDLRTKYVYRLMFFPIIIGSLVNVLMAFPVVSVLSIVYPATSSYVIMSSFVVILKASNRFTTKSDLEDSILKSLVILVLCAIALNRLLTLGIG
jgi:hypothetical protein